MTRVVRAAGGVVWRTNGTGLDVVLVHRPRYDDWSLPKGKLDPGEHPLAGALREVHEETGVRAVPQLRLPEVRYLTGNPDVEKAVDYWSMRAEHEDGRNPDDEVDEVRWMPVEKARETLSYSHDRGVLAAATEVAPLTGLVLLVRHAMAGDPDSWPGQDAARPLDEYGMRQAAALTALLRLYRPTRVVSATPQRCVQTVAPLAEELGLPLRVDPVFDEYRPPRSRAMAEALRRLAAEGGSTVVCGQGRSITPALPLLAPGNATAVQRYETAKGEGWVLGFAGDRLVAAQRLHATGPVPPARP